MDTVRLCLLILGSELNAPDRGAFLTVLALLLVFLLGIELEGGLFGWAGTVCLDSLNIDESDFNTACGRAEDPFLFKDMAVVPLGGWVDL